ncbi:MAG: RNA polymerase factor sigma-54 [Candidatus Omnitrophota bacterium]
MDLRQKTELRKVMAPELRQSLRILAISSLDLRNLLEEELLNNPCLEEEFLGEDEAVTPPSSSLPDEENGLEGVPKSKKKDVFEDISDKILSKKPTLQDVLLRQLGMFANSDEELRVGSEIIGNIDDNGFLKATVDELVAVLHVSCEEVEKAIALIQQFEPAGVGARTVSECLILQLKRNCEDGPLLIKIVESHLEDVAKKNYSLIAKSLKEPIEAIEPLIQKILKLDPKPGRNYSAEEVQRIIPDVLIEEKDEMLELTLNNEYVPTIVINRRYKEMLKKKNLDATAREFIEQKLRNAQELLRAVTKRQSTLRRVMERLVVIQEDAIRHGLSHLKPLTFAQLANELKIHETTVCRTIMNKFAKTPCGIVALKDLFSGSISDQNGESAVSTNFIKKVVKELIDEEDKHLPLSDEDIVKLIQEKHSLKVARRTVAKYRDELKIPATPYRRIR